MKITLAKALKMKNKMVAKISKLGMRVAHNNSYNEVNTPPYDSRKSLAEYDTAVTDLIRLKVAINTKNVGIAEPILKMGELKSKIIILRQTNTQEGEISGGGYSRMRSAASEPEKHKATIPQVEIDQMIEVLESELETLQDQVDHFNAITEIEF